MDAFQSQGLCLDDDDYFDMTITIHDKRFKCIRSILSNRSTFFRNVCTSMQHLYHSPKHVYVDLEDLPGGAATFQTILDFCHGKKINVVADKTFFYLHQAAALLGMNRSVENLEDRCELFWKDHILTSWESILGIMAMLKEGNLVLSKCQVGLYLGKCLRGLDLVMKDMNCRDLDRWICKLVILSTEHLELVFNTKKNWFQCKSKNVLKSFALAVHYLGTDGTSLVNKLGLIAKYLLEEKILEDKNTKSLLVLHDYMALKDVKHIMYILVLLQALSELMHKLRKRFDYEYLKWRYLEILKLEDLGVSSLESAVQVIIKFYTPKDGVLKENGKRFILSYIDHYEKSWCTMSFESFFATAKTLSVVLKDCHDALYDQIIRYEQNKDLSEEEKKSLGSLVNVATLSTDRVEQVLQSTFPFSLKEYVCLLRKENASLKKRQKRRLLTKDSLQFPKKRNKKVGETPTDIVRQPMQNNEEIVYAGGRMELYKEIEYEKKMECLINFCSSFHVSVITLAAEECFSFQIKASDTVSTIKKKLVHQMERNSVKVPAKEWNLGKGWKVMEGTSTAQEKDVGQHSLLRVLLLNKEGSPPFESAEAIQMPSTSKTEEKALELECSESETGTNPDNMSEMEPNYIDGSDAFRNNLGDGIEVESGSPLLETEEAIERRNSLERKLSYSSKKEANSGNMSELEDGSGDDVDYEDSDDEPDWGNVRAQVKSNVEQLKSWGQDLRGRTSWGDGQI